MKQIDWRLTLCSCVLLPLLAACGGGEDGDSSSNTGTTGTTGGDSFAGATYLLKIGGGDWDPGVGQELDPDAVPEFVLQVDGTPSAYTVTIGTGSTEATVFTQDMCNPTSSHPATSNPYPGFQLGPVNLPLYLKHSVQDLSVQTTAYGFTLTNVLLPDGVTAGDGKLSAVLDAREVFPVFPALGPGADQQDLCDQVATRGDTCKPCPDGQVFCLELSASYLGAPKAPITLQPSAGFDATCFFP
jgi:hypothetical protein